MILLNKTHIDYRKTNKDELYEYFTLKNLYTINNDIIKNEDSKSLILTPYNTFLSESDYNDEDNLDFKTENDINLMVK